MISIADKLKVALTKAGWDDSQHPRADDGKFTDGGGGGSARTPKGHSTFEMETALPVSDFMRGRNADPEIAFEDSANAGDKAKKEALAELKSIMGKDFPKSVSVKEVNFIEHDSPNHTHAAAYYNVKLSGPKADVARVRAAYEKENG